MHRACPGHGGFGALRRGGPAGVPATVETPGPQRLPYGAWRARSGAIAAFWLLGTAEITGAPELAFRGAVRARAEAPAPIAGGGSTCAGLPWRAHSYRPLLRRPG